MKYLVVTMPDLARWRIPARFIAEHRARCYATRSAANYQATYDKVASCLDDYTIMDWASNNMKWSDLAPVAERLSDEPVEIDDACAWTNVRMKVVDQI